MITPPRQRFIYAQRPSRSKTLAAVALAAVAVLAAPLPGQSTQPIKLPFTWGHVNMVGGGFITGIVGHPLDSDLRYARTDIGGTYRWNPATKKWMPLMEFLNDAQFNYIGTEAIGLDPNDKQALYIAAGTYTESFEGNGAMLVSHDQGRNFTIVPLPIKLGSNDAGRFAGERLFVDPNNGARIFFGSRNNGLWASQDYGLHWAQVAAFPVKGSTGTAADPGVGIIFGYFDRSSGTVGGATKVGYVGVSDNVGVYVTRDGGQTYAPLAGQPTGFYPNSMATDPSGNLYIAYGHSNYGNSVGPYSMGSGAIWKYTPGSGSTPGVWTNITPANPNHESYGFGSVAVDQSNPNIIMVGTMDRYYPPPQDDIFRSLDGGKTWSSLETNSVRDVSLSPWVTFGAAKAQAGNWVNHVWINPTNDNEVLYGNGQTVWQTLDVTGADSIPTVPGKIVVGGTTHWQIGAVGIEETAVNALLSPSAGPAHLLSGMYDLSGFTHTTLHKSPPQGASASPNVGSVNSLDFAAFNPLSVVHVGGSKPYGAYSLDGGLTYKAFASLPPTVTSQGSGTVTLTADGSTILWATYDTNAPVYYSPDHGTTWTASLGSPIHASNQSSFEVVADRVDPSTVYLYNPVSGTLYTSKDAGRSFTSTNSLPTYGQLQTGLYTKGDLWFSGGSSFRHSKDGGAHFATLPAVTTVYNFGLGAPFASNTPTLYLRGAINGYPTDHVAFFMSIDGGNYWFQINDDQHQYGNAYVMTGDPRVFGRVYIATNGLGIVEGDILF